MPRLHLKCKAPCVRYFYLPAKSTRNAEIVQIINSGGSKVKVPMREEDVELSAIFERELSMKEKLTYGNSETWKVFNSWEELELDHVHLELPNEMLLVVSSLSYRFTLEENMAVSA